MKDRDRFTLAYYEKLITKAKKTLKVAESETHTEGLILRHDVDLSFTHAYEFSRVEFALGIISTYYLLLTAESYNPFSRLNIRLLRKMADEGFEIGLHFDPRVYGPLSKRETSDKLQKEVSIMESMLEINILSYSLHGSMGWRGWRPELNKLMDAYDARIFGDDRYISDSTFSFRGKDPEEWVRKSKTRLIQFVTHPVQYFWYEE